MRRLRFDDSSSLTIKLALPLPTSERGYNVPLPAIHWLNDDALLGIFNYYRLDEKNGWNDKLGWCNLSQVCQRWRHLIYECSSHLGMHIKCTNGSPMVNVLDHLPRLPLFVRYHYLSCSALTVRRQDELGIYRILLFHGRIRHIELSFPPSILHRALTLMNESFPILEHLSLSCQLSADSGHHYLLTLPKAFLAPNLLHLTLIGIGLPKRLRVLTSTVSLVTLTLRNIQTSSYLRPRPLVAGLQFLPLLEELTIAFSIPIPRPSTERELLGENGVPITLPNLKTLSFHGVGAYLESLVAQIRVPLLEQLHIGLFHQFTFVLPHLFYLINNTTVFKLSSARITFYRHEVFVSMNHDHGLGRIPFSLGVRCKPLDWQIDCAAQICHALIHTLSGVEELFVLRYWKIPNEMQNGAIDSATWCDIFRSFIGVKQLRIGESLSQELSRALHVDEVGLDPGFLPNLLCIHAKDNLFTEFIDTRQAVGRPVQFDGSQYRYQSHW